MATLDSLQFEMERRIVLLHRDTSMPDDTQLGYVGDPNSVINGNTPGETLLYNAPSGTKFLDKGADPYERYIKVRDTAGGLWDTDAGGAGTGEIVEAEVFILDATDISNRYLALTYEPATQDEISFNVKNAPTQHYGDDYKQDDTFLKRITWELMDLESSLVIGDKITVTYTR